MSEENDSYYALLLTDLNTNRTYVAHKSYKKSMDEIIDVIECYTKWFANSKYKKIIYNSKSKQ